jgi:hypothetical protein
VIEILPFGEVWEMMKEIPWWVYLALILLGPGARV